MLHCQLFRRHFECNKLCWLECMQIFCLLYDWKSIIIVELEYKLPLRSCREEVRNRASLGSCEKKSVIGYSIYFSEKKEREKRSYWYSRTVRNFWMLDQSCVYWKNRKMRDDMTTLKLNINKTIASWERRLKGCVECAKRSGMCENSRFSFRKTLFIWDETGENIWIATSAHTKKHDFSQRMFWFFSRSNINYLLWAKNIHTLFLKVSLNSPKRNEVTKDFSVRLWSSWCSCWCDTALESFRLDELLNMSNTKVISNAIITRVDPTFTYENFL